LECLDSDLPPAILISSLQLSFSWYMFWCLAVNSCPPDSYLYLPLVHSDPTGSERNIQWILKLAIKWTVLRDIVGDTMKQMNAGVEPSRVEFEKRLSVVQNYSVGWLVNAYEAINKHEIVEKVSYSLKAF